MIRSQQIGSHPLDPERIDALAEDMRVVQRHLRSIFTPCDIAELYRIRWEVELLFRNWKGGVRMDHVHRLRNPTSLAVAVTASMLAALLSRDLHAALEALSETPIPKMSEFKDTVPPSMGGFSPRGIVAR